MFLKLHSPSDLSDNYRRSSMQVETSSVNAAIYNRDNMVVIHRCSTCNVIPPVYDQDSLCASKLEVKERTCLYFINWFKNKMKIRFSSNFTDTKRSVMNWKLQMDNSMRSLTRWQQTRKKLLPSGRNK